MSSLKGLKTALILCLTAVLFVSVLSACAGKENAGAESPSGSQSGSTPPASEPSASEDPFAEHMDISIAYWDIGKQFESKDEVLSTLEKKFNITFKPMQVGWSDYDQKYQMWAASGQLPDIFAHAIASDNPGVYADWAKQKLIRPLPDDLSAYPNVQKIAELPDVQALKREGKLYNLPRLSYSTNDRWALDRTVLVRKDWMEKLGFKDPQNFEEFSAMMKAFAENDPDGNNKQDTVGLTINVKPELLLSTVFPQYSNGSWVQEDGRWIPPYVSKKMDDVVSQLRKLYTDGGLDRDFAIMKVGDGREKFAQGKAGAYEEAATPGALKITSDLWSKYNPDMKLLDHVKVLHLWPDAEGNRYRFVTTTYWSESYFSPKVDDKKMDRIMRLYDYLLSPEGKALTTYGIEGKDYKKEGDMIVVTRAKDEKTGQFVDLTSLHPSLNVLKYIAVWGNDGMFEDNEVNQAVYGPEIMKTSLEEYNWMIENAKPIPTKYDIFAMSTPAKDKLSAINSKDDLFRVILSKDDPVQMWHDIVKGYDSKGMQEAIQEVNAELEKTGSK